MPEPPPDAARSPFAYAIVRVVPRVERGERLNAGIVLLCRPLRFVGAEMRLDEARLRSLDPDCDVDEVRAHLDLIQRIAAGDLSAGPIAALAPAERFHWLVAPSSTVIQPSSVHAGLTADPAMTLDHLVRTLVGAALTP
ncbi:MAG TPA: DUF3037 domain-containing protein [Candidatus Limnocylindrales bacterium]